MKFVSFEQFSMQVWQYCISSRQCAVAHRSAGVDNYPRIQKGCQANLEHWLPLWYLPNTPTFHLPDPIYHLYLGIDDLKYFPLCWWNFFFISRVLIAIFANMDHSNQITADTCLSAALKCHCKKDTFQTQRGWDIL